MLMRRKEEGLTFAVLTKDKIRSYDNPVIANDCRGRVSNLKDVAILAGVSPATASRALSHPKMVSEATRNRVLDAVKKLKYQPNHFARSLRQQTSKTIGLLITDILNPFYASVAKGVQDFIYDKGYHLILGNTDGDPEKETTFIRTFRSFQLQGLIVVPMQSTAASILDLPQVPVIEIDRLSSATGRHGVLVDNVRGAQEAIEHLIRLGHERIAIISGDLDVTTGEERFRGYLEAMRAAEISLNPRWIAETTHTEEGGYAAMQQLLAIREHQRPTAVFGFNSATTAGALRCIQDHGLRVPDDLSVVGFNDSPWAQRMSPPLTVVAQPSYELGRTAGKLLYRMLLGEHLQTDTTIVRLQPTLIIRSSTAAPRREEVLHAHA